MDTEVQNYVVRSANWSAAIATIGVWASIAAMCVLLKSTSEAPMVAGTMTTVIIWAMRKME